MGVSLNGGTPKSSILIEFSIINHPFWGTSIFGNTHMIPFIFLRLANPWNLQLYGCDVIIFVVKSRVENLGKMIQSWQKVYLAMKKGPWLLRVYSG